MPEIPDANHVLRYCRPSKVDNGVPQESAFEFRPRENYLSVNWMEHNPKITSPDKQIEAIRQFIIKKNSLTLSGNGRFARANVGKVKNLIEGSNVVSKSQRIDPSYAGIVVSRDEDRHKTLELANIIKTKDIFPAVD
ncbi:MAG: hypothetical protein GKS04_01360 [Candidatus Mycalebacterium zealandia]|nr:MAG: hypothetical protein GKS04_01360 [Candidatus Mycalebacterium zealandia]